MMDISVSTGASPADAAAGAASGRPAGKGSDVDGGSGFSDVLNKAGGGSDRKPASNGDGQQATTASDGSNAAVDDTPRRPTPKAVIDVAAAAVLTQAETETTTVNADKTAQKNGRIDLKSIRKQGDDQTPAAADAKMPDDLVSHVAKTDKSAKSDKTETKAAAADDNAASDVLSLLEQAPVDGASVAAATLVGHKTADTGTAETKDKSSGKVKAKDDAVADVASALAATTATAPDAEMPATAATDGSGQTFRLTRADNRDVSMDMHIGVDKDAAETGGKANVETVNVLDSRRYIGLAQNTNSAAVTAALSGDSEWAQAMQATSSLSNAAELSSSGKVVNTLKIQMNPIDLGLVTATLRLQGEALNVDLKVETAAAYRQLREDHGKMLESLRSQGYAIDGVTISMAPAASSDTGSQTNTQGGSQQSFAQSQGGEARERQNQSGQRSAGGFNVSGESDVAGASSGASGSSGPGDVYL